MTVRQHKRLMVFCGGLAAVLGLCVIGLGMMREPRIELATPTDVTVDLNVAAADPATSSFLANGIAQADLARVGVLNLRRPLYDPPRVAPPKARNISLPIKLVGTFEEAGHSMGVFQVNNGKTEIRRAGEQFDVPGGAVRIDKVEPHAATVIFNGKTHQLQAPKNPGGAAPSAGGRR